MCANTFFEAYTICVNNLFLQIVKINYWTPWPWSLLQVCTCQSAGGMFPLAAISWPWLQVCSASSLPGCPCPSPSILLPALAAIMQPQVDTDCHHPAVAVWHLQLSHCTAETQQFIHPLKSWSLHTAPKGSVSFHPALFPPQLVLQRTPANNQTLQASAIYQYFGSGARNSKTNVSLSGHVSRRQAWSIGCVDCRFQCQPPITLCLYPPWMYKSLVWLCSVMRPCKIQCTFYCRRVVKIIAPIFVYVGPPPLGSKWPQRNQLSNGVGC